MPSPFVRLTAILLATMLAAPPAFSADSSGETTARVGEASSTVVTPLRMTPELSGQRAPIRESLPTGAGAPTMVREPIPAGTVPHVALILPLSSPTLGSVADSVRQGFLAAAEAAGRNAFPIRVYSAVDDGPAALDMCQRAQFGGAVLVVAGLTRDGATAMARSECPRQTTLVLNVPQETPLPPRMYAISLSAEQEAQQVALMAMKDGWISAIVIASPTTLSSRVAEAFEQAWRRTGAGESRRVEFAGGPLDAPTIRNAFAGVRGDMVFLALDAATTLAVRPYIPRSLSIYTTSLGANPRAEPNVNVDLEGVRYVDMPWFVQPDHPAVMVYPPPKSAMSVEQERLYAFGIDAFRLSGILLRADAGRITLDGVTGRIVLDSGRRFDRTLVPAGFDAGRAVLLQPSP